MVLVLKRLVTVSPAKIEVAWVNRSWNDIQWETGCSIDYLLWPKDLGARAFSDMSSQRGYAKGGLSDSVCVRFSGITGDLEAIYFQAEPFICCEAMLKLKKDDPDLQLCHDATQEAEYYDCLGTRSWVGPTRFEGNPHGSAFFPKSMVPKQTHIHHRNLSAHVPGFCESRWPKWGVPTSTGWKSSTTYVALSPSLAHWMKRQSRSRSPRTPIRT